MPFLGLTPDCVFDIKVCRFLNASQHGQYKVVAVLCAKMRDPSQEDSVMVISLNSLLPEKTYETLRNSIALKLSLSWSAR